MSNNIVVHQFIFKANSIYSDIFDANTIGNTLKAAKIFMPAAWAGGNISIYTGLNGVSCQPNDDGTGTAANFSIPVAAGKNFSIDPALFYGDRFYMLVRSSPQGTDVEIPVSFTQV